MNSRVSIPKPRDAGANLYYSLELRPGVQPPKELLSLTQAGEISSLPPAFRESIEFACISHKRGNGKEKYLVKIPFINFNDNDIYKIYAMNHFDNLLVVDTGTKPHLDTFISSSFASRYQKNSNGDFDLVWESGFSFFPLEHLESLNELSSDDVKRQLPPIAEKFGLIKLLEFFQHEDLGRTGIVFDSDMGNISQFNYRQMPLLPENIKLPEGMVLIYASGEQSKKNLNPLCGMLYDCDERATANLKNFEESLSKKDK